MVGWGRGLESAQSPSGAPRSERTQDTIREASRSVTTAALVCQRPRAAVLQPLTHLQKLPETQERGVELAHRAIGEERRLPCENV